MISSIPTLSSVTVSINIKKKNQSLRNQSQNSRYVERIFYNLNITASKAPTRSVVTGSVSSLRDGTYSSVVLRISMA